MNMDLYNPLLPEEQMKCLGVNNMKFLTFPEMVWEIKRQK